MADFERSVDMVGLIATYNRLAGNLTASIKQIAEQPQVSRDVQYYEKAIGQIKSIDDFMSNTRVYNFALKAFGLEDMQYAKAFIRKVLQEGTDSPQAFSLQLSDQRFREFAEVFNFKRYASATTSFDRAQSGTVDRYLRNSLEQRSAESSEALRLALYFERKVGSVTSSYGILADKALYQVVRTALGLPAAISGTDIDKQAKIIADKMDFKRILEPAYIKQTITRFLGRYEAENGSSTPSPATTLLAGTNSGVDMKMILSLQTLRKFGV
jgi:hypothetical protein